jgi:hypothetical protein
VTASRPRADADRDAGAAGRRRHGDRDLYAHAYGDSDAHRDGNSDSGGYADRHRHPDQHADYYAKPVRQR